MAIRTPQEMKLHDSIITSVKSIYMNQKGALSVATCNDKVPVSIKGVSPDLVAKLAYTLYFRIETDSTVTDGSAIMWKQMSETLGTFYLLVPHYLQTEASDIIKRLAIPKIVLTTYQIKNNKLVFGNLP